MSRTRRPGPRLAFRIALACVAALALGAAAAGPILAAGVAWGTPSASSQYGAQVAFSQPATLPTDTTRVEMLLTVPGTVGPFVTEVVPDALGRPVTLRYGYDTAASHVYPNTRFEGRWRVTRADGSVDLGPSVSVTYADTTHDWRTKAGDIVRVHWYQGDDRFAERVLAVGEEGLTKASEFLGVTESAPVDFFIYASRDDFMAAFGSGSQEWAGAFALPETRTLIADIPPDEFDTQLVSIYVPHELAHVVIDTATANPYHEPPRWLNEGLAVYLTEGYAPNWRSSLRDGVADGRLLPLGAIATLFPTTTDGADLAYAESVSAVSHMVDRYGKDALVRLIRAYAGGVSDDEAFTAGLGVTVGEFEADWLASIGASAPERQGPQPAPPGPVPAAWLGASPAPSEPAAGSSPAAPEATGPARTVAPPQATPPAGGGVADDQSGLPLLVVTVAAVAGVVIASLLFFAATRRRRARGGSGPGTTSPGGTGASGGPEPEGERPAGPAATPIDPYGAPVRAPIAAQGSADPGATWTGDPRPQPIVWPAEEEQRSPEGAPASDDGESGR